MVSDGYWVFKVGGNAPSERHDTYEKALAEATRLAHKEGRRNAFYVVKTMALVSATLDVEVKTPIAVNSVPEGFVPISDQSHVVREFDMANVGGRLVAMLPEHVGKTIGELGIMNVWCLERQLPVSLPTSPSDPRPFMGSWGDDRNLVIRESDMVFDGTKFNFVPKDLVGKTLAEARIPFVWCTKRAAPVFAPPSSAPLTTDIVDPDECYAPDPEAFF